MQELTCNHDEFKKDTTISCHGSRNCQNFLLLNLLSLN